MLNLSPCNTFADKIDEKRLVRDFFGARHTVKYVAATKKSNNRFSQFQQEYLRARFLGVRRTGKYVAATEILNQAFIAKRPANKSKKCCMLNLSPCNTFADKIDEKRLVRDFFGARRFWREDIVVPFVTTYAIPLRPAFATSYITKNSIA